MPPRLNLFLDLLEAGSLPLSRLKAALGDLRTPLDAGLIRRKGQGAGEVVAVLNPDGFRAWIRNRHPGAFGDYHSDTARGNNLAMNRDSKRGLQGLDYYSISARAHGMPSGLAPEDQVAMACIIDATRRFGAVQLHLGVPEVATGRLDPILPKGLRLMTVENPTNFASSSFLSTEADAFLFCGSGGRMREAFIEWVMAQAPSEVIHFGDYDPVGLQEFGRLAKRFPGKVRLHLIPGLEESFRTFSNRSLLDLDSNRTILANLEKGLHPSADRVLDLILLHGPLEQEAMLVRHLRHPIQ